MADILKLDSRGKIWDALLELQSNVNVATSQEGKISGTATYRDLGAGYVQGLYVVDLNTIDKPVAGGSVLFMLQLAKDTSFSSWVPAAIIAVGDAVAGPEMDVVQPSQDKGVGRYSAPFHNDYGGYIYRYARHYVTVGGTITTGATHRAFITKLT